MLAPVLRLNWTGEAVKVRRSVEVIVEGPVNDTRGMTDDELAHAVMTSVSDQLGWTDKSTVDWFAYALPTPSNASNDHKPIAIQVRTVT